MVSTERVIAESPFGRVTDRRVIFRGEDIPLPHITAVASEVIRYPVLGVAFVLGGVALVLNADRDPAAVVLGVFALVLGAYFLWGWPVAPAGGRPCPR